MLDICFSSASRRSSESETSRPLRVPETMSLLASLNWASRSLSSLTAEPISESMSARKDWIACVPLFSVRTTWRAASTAFSARLRLEGEAE